MPGEDQLHGALLVPQQAGEPVDVVEDQAGALVGREAPGEADRQDVRVQGGLELGEDRGSLPVAGELVAQAPAGEDRQLALLAGVGLPELLGRDLVEPLPEAPALTRLIDVVEVHIEVALEQAGDRGADPGRAVDAVGQPEDLPRRDLVPGCVGRLGVELADRVGPVREPQREGRHVELLRVVVDPKTQLQHGLDRDLGTLEEGTRHPPHEVGLEALVARRNRRVDREDRIAADALPRLVERGALRDELAGALGEQERRVALVQVPDGRLEPECADRANAADAEDQLLVEAHLAAADIQHVRDRAVRVRVGGHVRVEQEHRHAANLRQPDGGGHVAPGDLDDHRQRHADGVLDTAQREAVQVVVGVVVLLVPVGVDRLAEVALAVQQADTDERDRHVARGFHVIAGEHAEAAGVDPERFVEAVFGAEVGDRPLQPGRVLALEPLVRPVGHVVVELGDDVRVVRHEPLIREELVPVNGARQDRDRVAVARPGRPVDSAPQRPGARVPRPVHVVGEAAKAFESGGKGKARGRYRRHAHGFHWPHDSRCSC